MQAEVFFLVELLGLDYPADKFLNLRDKPDEDAGIDDVEARVEGGEHEVQLLVGIHVCHVLAHAGADIVDEPNHEIDEPVEHKENPDDTEDVEEHVGQGGSACLRVGREGSQIRGDGGSDVLAQHQRNTLIDGHGTRRAE